MNKLILGISLLVLISIGFLSYSYIFGGCVSSQEFAKSQVLKQLKKMGLSNTELNLDSERTTKCKVSFIYKGEGNLIYFSVIDGGKVTWWDTKKRGPL